MPETENQIRTEGSVVAVSIDGKHRFSKTTISLTKGHGVEGDAHYGPFVRHRYLARRDPTAANLRQVHLIPGELLDALRTRSFEVRPGNPGENITIVALDLAFLWAPRSSMAAQRPFG